MLDFDINSLTSPRGLIVIILYIVYFIVIYWLMRDEKEEETPPRVAKGMAVVFIGNILFHIKWGDPISFFIMFFSTMMFTVMFLSWPRTIIPVLAIAGAMHLVLPWSFMIFFLPITPFLTLGLGHLDPSQWQEGKREPWQKPKH